VQFSIKLLFRKNEVSMSSRECDTVTQPQIETRKRWHLKQLTLRFTTFQIRHNSCTNTLSIPRQFWNKNWHLKQSNFKVCNKSSKPPEIKLGQEQKRKNNSWGKQFTYGRWQAFAHMEKLWSNAFKCMPHNVT
jgi:hypothetical protein